MARHNSEERKISKQSEVIAKERLRKCFAKIWEENSTILFEAITFEKLSQFLFALGLCKYEHDSQEVELYKYAQDIDKDPNKRQNHIKQDERDFLCILWKILKPLPKSNKMQNLIIDIVILLLDLNKLGIQKTAFALQSMGCFLIHRVN